MPNDKGKMSKETPNDLFHLILLGHWVFGFDLAFELGHLTFIPLFPFDPVDPVDFFFVLLMRNFLKFC